VRGNESEQIGHKGFFDEAFRWLDHYVKGDTTVDTTVDPAVEVAEGDGRWRGEAQWPPADVVVRRLALNQGSYTDDDSNVGDGSGAGVGSWSISAPLPYDVHLAGVPKLTVQVSTPSPHANLVGLLYDIDAKGQATLIQRGAMAISNSTTEASFELYPDDWTIAARHRIGVLLAGSDEDWWTPPHSQLPVDIAGGTISLPLLTFERDGYLDGSPTPAMKTRQPFAVPADALSASPSAFEQPPALAPRPKGTTQGAAPMPKSARKPANRLRVKARGRGSRIRVTVRGAGASKVRLTLVRGSKAVARRTVRARRNVARASFRVTVGGRYRVTAKLLGGVRLKGRSRPMTVKP
jgi:hypothetical protein